MAPLQEAEVLYVVTYESDVVGLFDSIPKASAIIADLGDFDKATIHACVLNRKLVFPLKCITDKS